MKKTYRIIVCLFVLFAAPLFAQESEKNAESAKNTESEVYYVSARILKIFLHPKGYRVIYRTTGLKTAEAYVPFKWSNPGDGRAVFTQVSGRVSPYITFFLRNGEFDFVKVAVPKDPKHYSWGILKAPVKYNDKFEQDALEVRF